MPRPMFVVHGISARERYDGVAANLFEVENERFVVQIVFDTRPYVVSGLSQICEVYVY